MQLIGNKCTFALELSRDEDAYQLSLYIQNKDILMYEYKGSNWPFRWHDIVDIVEWFERNMPFILKNDSFPVKEIPGETAAELYKMSHDMLFEQIEEVEEIAAWTFRHTWFSARAGAFLADVYFRCVGNKIEISWDNTETFNRDGVKFLYPNGYYYVELNVFEKVITQFIRCYRSLKDEEKHD